jgi:hypothetical protein
VKEQCRGKAAVTIDKRDFDAAIFDLDGVLTDRRVCTPLLGKLYSMFS